MSSPLEQLKQSVRTALPDLDMVIAWVAGSSSLTHTPLFITKEEEIDRIQWDARCAQNLVGYLPALRDKKVGILLKGCDARSLVELIQERLIDRDNITIFAMHCQGTLSAQRLRKQENWNHNAVTAVEVTDTTMELTQTDGTNFTVPLAEVLFDKCMRCKGADASPCDHFFGENGPPPTVDTPPQTTLQALEEMPVQDRARFWEKEMERCIRCYACRSACSLCVCQDHCVAQSREPKLLDQTDLPREKLMFQAIHALHTAGRCTECGECERACPMDIPVMSLKETLNKKIKDIFDYEAGMDPEATPPLFQFREEEQGIKERKWK